jgi:catechol 2,3-dioxygenase-like lactoylglutathione lyase family enzyme
MEHVGIVVDDLEAAKGFFLDLGLEDDGTSSASGEWVDRIVGIDGIEVEAAMMRTPANDGRLELIRFDAPPGPDGDPRAPATVPGLRHLAFRVDDIDETVARLEREHGAELEGEIVRYGDIFRLCYLRGPAGIIVELAERL